MRASNRLRIMAERDFADASCVFGTALVAGGPALPGSPADPVMSHWLQDWATVATPEAGEPHPIAQSMRESRTVYVPHVDEAFITAHILDPVRADAWLLRCIQPG